jgi:DNA-directed RNA polymerase subunit beta
MMLLVELNLRSNRKGESMPEPGLPESFNVLMHELKGLGLDIRLEE